jgi:uncharacterized protein
MRIEEFSDRVNSVEELAALIGTPSELVMKKQLAALDAHMVRFIAESPFLLLGTVDQQGNCDVSPRGDAFGLATVVDATTLLIPERRGNRRADSLKNIIETGRVGLLFLIPGVGETLRVNGRACVIKDPARLAPMAADGKVPLVAIAVEIEECFLQCAKAILRSRLWESASERAPSSVPCLAEMLASQVDLKGQTVESLNQQIEESYKNNLY